jgi:hypothetical protein
VVDGVGCRNRAGYTERRGETQVWIGVSSRLKPVITEVPGDESHGDSGGGHARTEKLTYQWYRNGEAIVDATGETYDSAGAWGAVLCARVESG